MSAVPEALELHTRIPSVVIMNLISFSFIFLISYLATRKTALVPRKLQNGLEMVFEFICNMAKADVGPEAKKFFPVFIGIFLYVFISNAMGLVPGLASPTANLNTTLGLSLVVIIGVQIVGISRSPVGYIKHFSGHVPSWLKPMMFMIEVVGEFAKIVSLSFRLFGNIISKEIVLGIFAVLVMIFLPSAGPVEKSLTLVPVILRPLFILLGILVSLIQAFVFTKLSMLYVASAVKIHR